MVASLRTGFVSDGFSDECASPMVCPNSWVITSARFVAIQNAQPAKPSLIITSPSVMRTNVVPFTVEVEESVLQNPPIARVPPQFTGAPISSNGSLNWIVFLPSQVIRRSVGVRRDASRFASGVVGCLRSPAENTMALAYSNALGEGKC